MAKRKFSKVGKNKPGRRRNKNYPVIYCLNEDIAIAVSYNKLTVKGDKFGRVVVKDIVDKSHWYLTVAVFRDGYYIDMTDYKDGDKVLCPKCNEPVDFRLFPSGTKPKLINIRVPSKDEEYTKIISQKLSKP